MVERREAFKPQFEEPPRQALVEPQLRPTLVAIGIGGATLDAILPLVQEGRLPFFASMIESGAHARLVSYPPRRTASLWTSLSSGMLPFRHGVLDDRIYAVPFLAAQGHLRLAPAGHSVTHWGFLGAAARPVNASTSEVLTIWEVLERLGVSYGLIGWPLSDPAPEGALFAFSDRFFDGQYGRSSAHPKELAERGTLFRPDLAAIDPAQVLGPSIELTPAVREALRQDMWRESLTRFLLEQEPRVGALFIYLPGLEHISRAYLGAYYDVRFEGKQGSERQAAASYLVRYYEHLDRYLQSVLGRIQEPSVVAVVSAHGYEAPRGWATLPSRLMAENAWRGTSSGAPDGVLMLSGRGIERGVFLNAAQLSDVVPTVLYAMGLPIARDLDGRVLTGAFSSGYLARQPLTFIPSYETLDRAEEQQQPPEASTEVAPGG
jgi:predicted AlkP superfamily phosphohydrolase/phosphomutase